jgi:hypothetical protein
MKVSFQPLSSESANIHRFARWLTVAILAAGVVLSLAQFLFNRSLWWDEAAMALNIIHRSSAELLQPLDYAQSAPVLFLQILKKHIRADECIYAGFAAPEVLFYYRDIGFIPVETPARIKGLPQQADEWEKVRGKNWLLFGHNGEITKTKEAEILNRLDKYGYKKLKEYKSVNASVYLYDCGE